MRKPLCWSIILTADSAHGAIPKEYIKGATRVSSADMSVHILNHFYEKLNDVCLVQGGELANDELRQRQTKARRFWSSVKASSERQCMIERREVLAIPFSGSAVISRRG
ncbi:hypothetical protein L2E82_50051 [Cichorium intybus]|nr:hypothetical protein L2E82_50051 [Cichorium intybus]